MLKTKKFRRLLAGLLAVLMLSVCLPVGAFATGEENQTVAAGMKNQVIVKVQFTCDGEVVKSGDFFVPAGTQNYSVLEQYMPEGYKMLSGGDFFPEEYTEKPLVVNIEKVNTDVIMNVVFVYNDESVGGGDYFLPEGVQNYSILEQYVPEGYEMTVSGDFMVEENGSIKVSVEPIVSDVIMNVVFVYNDESVGGGDYFLPEGVQNYSILEQYVPEGYEMTISGDFFVKENGSIEVSVKPIQSDVIMKIRFVLADGSFVGGGDYFLPEGVQNYSILNQYVPEGYKLAVSGDFMVTAGASENVRVEPLNDEIIVNIQFEDRYGNVIAGGDYFVPAGIQNRTVLDEYVPNGYVQAVTGDIEFVAGQHYDIVLDEGTSIVNIQFIDRDGNVIAGGDYFVPTGIHNRTVLDQYVPEGYRQCVTGDIQFIYGYHYEIIIELIPEEVVTKTAIFRKAEGDTWNENLDNPDEVHYTFWSDDTDATCIVPSITAGDETKELDYWVSEIDETVILVPGEEFCYNDLDKGELEGCVGDFAFYPVYKDVQTEEPTKPSDPSTGDNTTTVTGKDEHPDIAEAKANGTWGAPTATPAAASTIPQTGDSMPVVMLIVIALVAAGAVGGLVVLRKRSHQ